jgi:CrcB protein
MLTVLVICIGACAGALLRWQFGIWGNNTPGMPLGTLAANLLGGYLVGLCVGIFEAMPQLDPHWRLLLVTGFLGALTTFSSFSAEVVGMLQETRLGLAALTAGTHLAGSLALTWLGLKTVQWFGSSSL